jgi:lipopolysaccharide export system protein LptA
MGEEITMSSIATMRLRLVALIALVTVCLGISAQASKQQMSLQRAGAKEMALDTTKRTVRRELLKQQPLMLKEVKGEVEQQPVEDQAPQTVTAVDRSKAMRQDTVANRVRARHHVDEQPVVLHDTLAAPADTTRERYVYLLHADETRFNQRINPDAQILVGDVVFRHDSMYMYCDSALFYEASNSLDAYGNVHMTQGDTLHLYGDRLHYSGDEMLAKVRENVVMIDKQMTLTTDSLNYDRTINLGYYFNWGTLEDTLNVLTSEWGEYDTQTNDAIFNYEVTLTNPNFVLTSDTLHYNTNTQIATIVGPSNIDSDNSHIYSTLGRYYTADEHAELLNRSVLTNGEKRIVGDSLYYARHDGGYGEVFDNVVMDDYANKMRLTGDYVYYNELSDSAYATRRAIAIDYSQGDSMFIHGDTLRLLTRHADTDSVYRIVQAYHKVRIYREDVQAVCDSMEFNALDSCMTMYYDPVVWNGPQQILGEVIRVYMNDSTVEWAHIENQALIVEQISPEHFNQISGREVKAYFVNGDIDKSDVIGNVMVVYYYSEAGDSIAFGMNTTECSYLTAFMKDRQVDKLFIKEQSNGVFYPIAQIPDGKDKLDNFAWLNKLRPMSKYDIMIWRGKDEEQKLKATTRRNVPLPSLKGITDKK